VKKTLIKPSNIFWPEDFDLGITGMSQSLWDMWCGCNRKFLLHLNGYRNPKKVFNTNFGSMSHDVLDKVYTKGDIPRRNQISKYISGFIEGELKTNTPMTMQQLEIDAAKCEGTLVPHFDHYRKDFSNKNFIGVEKYFETKYKNIKIRGKIDAQYISLIADKSKWNMEHKTKGQISENTLLIHLNLDFQNLYYLLADEMMKGKTPYGTNYNVIRNTQAKPLKGEPLNMYMKRVEESIRKNPSHTFKRWEIPYTSRDHTQFRNELDIHIKDIKHKQNKPVAPNRFSCTKPFACPYLEACAFDNCKSLTQETGSLEERLFPELKEDIKNDTKKKKIARRIAKRI